ncbi:Rab-like protein 2A [Physocladia obscura]|uniref:Rab-like protein 2A n=1 Tax=Physocladia obscura TaxID=109957 RepID=A0AAD5STW1_9FUNG|nr:Rab-like protein 2A [Physocladia obscura]
MSTAFDKPADVKVILLGDSAVGKSKLIERFLLNDFVPHQLSTYALTLYRHTCSHPMKSNKKMTVEFWDTAGQERFNSMHPSYYIGAHACVLCFDMTRKITYKNLDNWYDQLTAYRGITIPIIVIANKVDMDASRARKNFGFLERRRAERREKSNIGDNSAKNHQDDDHEQDMPLFLCSASDGTNVVAAFKEAIRRAVAFKEGGEIGGTFVDEILSFIREEEGSVDGLFAKDTKRIAAASYETGLDKLDKKFRSDLTINGSNDGSSVHFLESRDKSHDSVEDSNVSLDSDDEEELRRKNHSTCVKNMRKANLVTQ